MIHIDVAINIFVFVQVTVPIVSNDKCKDMFLKAGRHEYIPDIFMCAGFEEGGRDSCQVFTKYYFLFYETIPCFTTYCRSTGYTFNIELILKILFIRAILEAHCKFAARMESTFWPALSVGALAALRPIFQEFVQEYPNSPRGS